MDKRDPITRLLLSFYKERIRRFTTLVSIVVGLAGGLFIISAVLEKFLLKPPEKAFLYGTLLYVGLLVIIILIYGFTITFRLIRDPSKLFGSYTDLRPLLNEWTGKLYGLERTRMKEDCEIEYNGSFNSKIGITTTATVADITAFEIYSQYFGPLSKSIVLDRDLFHISPIEYEEVDVRDAKYRKGHYEICFPKELPVGLPVTIEYEESGEDGIFATNTQDYPEGLSYDFLERGIWYPTRWLIIEIYFKNGYPLSIVRDRPNAVVWYGGAKVEHSEETERAQIYFDFENRRASLKIPSPILGLYYAIRWTVES